MTFSEQPGVALTFPEIESAMDTAMAFEMKRSGINAYFITIIIGWIQKEDER